VFIALCDDNRVQLRILEDTARGCELWRNEPLEIVGFLSGAELLNSVRSGDEYEYIFLDIEMPELSGFEVYAELSKNDGTSVIFVSSHIELLPEAFALHPYGFLAKPFNQDTFDRTVKSVIEQKTESQFFKYTFNGFEKAIPCRDIISFFSKEHVLEIYKVNDSPVTLLRCKLDDVEAQLSGYGFFRCNRSTLVNLRYCYDRNGKAAVMKYGDLIIEISRRKQADFDAQLLHYKMGDKYAF
jgi:DNA-binding LytR/AlgR family response regulator